MTKIIACLAAFMTLVSLATASTEYSESDVTGSVKQIDESMTDNIIYKNDNVVVTKSEPLAKPNIANILWDMPTETELYDNCDIIADVTVRSLEEVAVTYTFMGTECTSYKTLANVSVNKMYYSADEKVGREFTVAIPNSSYSFDEDFPETAAGERCIVFITSTKGLDDSLELYNYADYYLSSPAEIVNISGSKVRANKIFAAYSDNTVSDKSKEEINLIDGEILDESAEVFYSVNDEVISTEKCEMPFADFENTLKEKINEKLGESEYKDQ